MVVHHEAGAPSGDDALLPRKQGLGTPPKAPHRKTPSPEGGGRGIPIPGRTRCAPVIRRLRRPDCGATTRTPVPLCPCGSVLAREYRRWSWPRHLRGQGRSHSPRAERCVERSETHRSSAEASSEKAVWGYLFHGSARRHEEGQRAFFTIEVTEITEKAKAFWLGTSAGIAAREGRFRNRKLPAVPENKVKECRLAIVRRISVQRRRMC
jgi:hypothetical protein